MVSAKPSSRSRTLCLLLIVCGILVSVEAKRRRNQKEEELTTQAEKDPLASLTLYGVSLQTWIYSFTAIVVAFFSAVIFYEGTKGLKGNRPNSSGVLNVVVVGTGLPKKGMGWYHLTQLLDMPNVNVTAVVEPFFLNQKLCPEMPSSFAELVYSLNQIGVATTSSIESLKRFKKPTMCLIAGRTPDNPILFRQCIQKGASVIYLEKPGAPSVAELEEMKALADSKNAKVYLGYNKNVTPYVRNALDLAQKTPGSQVVFCHNNSYKPKDLPECFFRNSEGMLKNMAIHELALLVSFFDVTVDTIKTFWVNPSNKFSEKVTILKPGTSPPSQEYITDFSRVAFEVTTKSGTSATVMADRCGGNVSWALVKDKRDRTVKKFDFPDKTFMVQVDEKCKADPEMMPYFFIQSDDYLELKKRVVASALEGNDAAGVATIQVAIEALKLAEYGTKELGQALKAK